MRGERRDGGRAVRLAGAWFGFALKCDHCGAVIMFSRRPSDLPTEAGNSGWLCRDKMPFDLCLRCHSDYVFGGGRRWVSL